MDSRPVHCAQGGGGLRGLLAAVLASALLGLTVAASAASADPVLAGAGDIACPPGSTTDASNCHQATTAQLVQGQSPTAVVVLGDNQYNSGLLTEYTGAGAFDQTW